MFEASLSNFNSKIYRLITAPTVEPVSLVEAKAYLRVDGSDEDALITSLIAAARRGCEEYTKRAFITQTWTLAMDVFSDFETASEGGYYSANVPGLAPGVREGERCINLSRQPIQSIEKIESFDSSNTSAILDTSIYALTEDQIVLNSGKSWPTSLRASNAVKITFKAGYGDTADKVPEPIQLAIKAYAGAMYENRSCLDMPDGVKSLIDPFRLPEAFGAW